MSDKWLVRTKLLLSEESFSWWNNITYLYDRNWIPVAGELTLPFALFHIIGYQEIKTSDLSTKRVILYDPVESEESESGVMQVISDNIVTKPMSYQIDVIAPFQIIGMNYLSRYNAQEVVWKYLVNEINENVSTEERVQKPTPPYNGFNIEDLKKFNESNPNLNKDSLDLMVASGRILELKSWLNGVSKYVVVTNSKSVKKAEEEHAWRVSLECKEVPILTADTKDQSINSTLKIADKDFLDQLGKILGKPSISDELTYYQNNKDL